MRSIIATRDARLIRFVTVCAIVGGAVGMSSLRHWLGTSGGMVAGILAGHVAGMGCLVMVNIIRWIRGKTPPDER